MATGSPTRETYFYTAGALMVLLALTVGASYVPLGDWSIVVALTIAFAKALVIALFFMHVRYGSRMTMLFASAGVFWLLVMFVLTFGDYVTRY